MIGITELSKMYAEGHGVSLDTAHNIIMSVINVVEDGILESGGVQLIDHLTLKAKVSEEHNGTHPRTHEKLTVPRKVYISAKAGKGFAKKLNETF